MRFRLLVLAALIAAAPALLAQSPAWQPAPGHLTLHLWPHGAPGEPPHPAPEVNLTTAKIHRVAGRIVTQISNVSDPTLTLYKPQGRNTHTAVLVFPGGAYQVLAIDLEGTEICQWLNSIGVNCILVKYRVPNSGPYPKSAAALQDAQRAMGLVRQHAGQWHINPHHIGVIGFSAGAYLAAALSTNYQHRLYSTIDAADSLSCRPDFAMVIYPGYIAVAEDQMKLNSGIHVTPHTPPAFLVQAEDDPVHVENVIQYFLALKHAGVPAQMHVFAYGGHGYGLRPVTQSTYIHDVPATNKTPLPISHWPSLAAAWMRSIGMLK
jgi:acetyl esterase/lipase